MEDIELSVMSHEEDPATPVLRSALQAFEAKHNIHVRITVLPLADQWSRIVQMALYKEGPDVSSVGSTWISDLVRMNAIRPFQAEEVSVLGGEESFLPASWRSANLTASDGTQTVWGAPWFVDTRIICYRRDLLEQAQIDPATAFATCDTFETTLRCLQEAGVETPFVFPTRGESWINLHSLSSWIWGAGGNYLSPDANSILFNEPPARDGLKRFFRLGRYLSQQARFLDDTTSNFLFTHGLAAVTLGGYWIPLYVEPDLQDVVECAPPPGIPFIGGHHLVVWNYSRKQSAAFKLVEFLAGPEVPDSLFPTYGIPARQTVLAEAPTMKTHPYNIIVPTLHKGESFPASQTWGSIEKRLVDVLPLIWKDVLAEPDPDLDAILDQHLTPLARRLSLSMMSLK